MVPGEVVMLKSGGPDMVVLSEADYETMTGMSVRSGLTGVVWIDTKDGGESHPHIAAFPASALVVAE